MSKPITPSNVMPESKQATLAYRSGPISSKGGSVSDRRGKTSIFHYNPLRDSGASIRTFDIVKVDGIIECELRSTTRMTRYTAISYVCGTSTCRNMIKVNGAEFHVKDNLFGILEELLQREVTKNIWVDAISIDQNNINERNDQVTRMADTYKRASKVLYWLGLDRMVDPCFEYFSLGGADTAYETLRTKWDRLQFAEPEEQKRIAVGLRQITLCEYWKRAWCVQEVLLSQKRGSIILGSNTLPWPDFMDFFGFLNGAVYSKVLPGFTPDLVNRPIVQFYRAMNDYNRAGMKRNGLTLDTVLAYFYTTRCTDPRDRIFAFRMILNDPSTIRVQYQITKEELFCQLASQHILKHREEQFDVDENVEPVRGGEYRSYHTLRALAIALEIKSEFDIDMFRLDPTVREKLSSTFETMQKYPGG